MSYIDNSDSEARKTIEARKKVNFVSWGERNVNEGKQWCPVCNVVLLYKENGNIAWCKSCGNETPVGQIKTAKTLRSKFGETASAGPMLFSQPRRSRRENSITDSTNAELSEEDKAELRGMGFML